MDWTKLGVDTIAALTPIVTMLFVWAVRLVKPRIPTYVLPIIAAVGPFLVSLLANYIAGAQLNPILMALLGAAASWLRDIISEFTKTAAAKRLTAARQLAAFKL